MDKQDTTLKKGLGCFVATVVSLSRTHKVRGLKSATTLLDGIKSYTKSYTPS